ncbi:MAG: response regulator [Gemmatimonadetes bacterium]|jgi:DNA-binding response OmpR family regulator|nr:response regulator [Gemmatimonadota bacterium]
MQNGKYVILCVDDDPDIREYLKVVLEANDYAVVTAASAEEGLKAYGQSEPDALILDLMMEEVDAGTNMVIELKALGNKSPIYMLSSTGDNLSRTIDTAALGLSGVFQKPLNSDVLLSLLKSRLK